MSKRIPAALRRRIIEDASSQDPFECPCCQFKFIFGVEDPNISIDHIIPTARGGLTIEENLRVTCISCNMSKMDAAGPIDNRKKIYRIVLCSCGSKISLLDFDYHVNIDLVQTNALLCIGCGGEVHDETPHDPDLEDRFSTVTKKGMRRLGL
jgi:hypothetical protein